MKKIIGLIMIVLGCLIIVANINNASDLLHALKNNKEGYATGYIIGIVTQIIIAVILLYFGSKFRKNNT